MRRVISIVIGLLECVVAGLLVWIGFQLPTSADVAAGFGRAERVAEQAGRQVQLLRRHARELRRPEVAELAGRLQAQTRAVAELLRAHELDFETLATVRDALQDVSTGLDGLADRAAAWPDLRMTLSRSATLLRTAHRQVDKAVRSQEGYESAVRESLAAADSFVAVLPTVTDAFDTSLLEQEHALNELEEGLEQAKAALPTWSDQAIQLSQAGKLLAWLLAIVAGLHGVLQLISSSHH